MPDQTPTPGPYDGLFSSIVILVARLIKTLRKGIRTRIIFAILGFCIGTTILFWTLNQVSLKEMGSPGAAMIALSGVFYGTISLALLLGILERSEKLTSAKSIHSEFKSLADSTSKTPDEKLTGFESRLVDVLKTIF